MSASSKHWYPRASHPLVAYLEDRMTMENKDGVEGLKLFISLHQAQLASSGVPEIFWATLYHKLKHGIFDAGYCFGLAQVEADDEDAESIDKFNLWKVLVTNSEGVKASDAENIFLVDHAWTFRPEQARTHLRSIPGLLQRMCNLVGVDLDENDQETSIKAVINGIWKYSQSYSIANPNVEAEDRVPVWYIMDEFGSRIQHSDTPNARVVPFYYIDEQATYSLLFPIADLEENDEVTRDFVEGTADPVQRAALLLPWSNEFIEEYLPSVSLEQEEPGPEYFTASRLNETFPVTDKEYPELPKDRPIRTYVEYTFIREFLKHPRFELVDNPDEAEILWLSSHFKNFRELSEESPHKRINQFPCEHLLTVKDLNCIISRRAKEGSGVDPETLETDPKWLPVTFNLKTEIPKLIAFYLAQKEKGKSNYWIIKPWNLARSLDTHITDNLDQILRLSLSGPKICQKYIERPVLFYREDVAAKVKFDVRYIVLLRSVEPLKAYAYERFWLRFANKPYELDHFDEYERHFTVMNYTATSLHQMFCHDFVKYFEEQNPGQSWAKVQKRIFSMLTDLFKAACKGDNPSTSLKSAPQSRAMYAVDLMLSWTDEGLDGEPGPSIQPKLLELNWAPDCKRACNYYPEFFDDVFSVLFLDETEGKYVHVLE